MWPWAAFTTYIPDPSPPAPLPDGQGQGFESIYCREGVYSRTCKPWLPSETAQVTENLDPMVGLKDACLFFDHLGSRMQAVHLLAFGFPWLMPDATQDASTRNKEFIQTCKRIARPGRAELQSCFIVLLAVTVPMCRCGRLLQFVELRCRQALCPRASDHVWGGWTRFNKASKSCTAGA